MGISLVKLNSRSIQRITYSSGPANIYHLSSQGKKSNSSHPAYHDYD